MPSSSSILGHMTTIFDCGTCGSCGNRYRSPQRTLAAAFGVSNLIPPKRVFSWWQGCTRAPMCSKTCSLSHISKSMRAWSMAQIGSARGRLPPALFTINCVVLGRTKAEMKKNVKDITQDNESRRIETCINRARYNSLKGMLQVCAIRKEKGVSKRFIGSQSLTWVNDQKASE